MDLIRSRLSALLFPIPSARESPAQTASHLEWDLTACVSRGSLDGVDTLSHQGLCSTRTGLLVESCTHPEFHHHCVLLMLPAPRMSYCRIFACWNSESPLDTHIRICSCDESAPDPPAPPWRGRSDFSLWRASLAFGTVSCSACFSLLTGASLLTDCASVHFCYFESTLRRGTLSLSSLQVS